MVPKEGGNSYMVWHVLNIIFYISSRKRVTVSEETATSVKKSKPDSEDEKKLKVNESVSQCIPSCKFV